MRGWKTGGNTDVHYSLENVLFNFCLKLIVIKTI